MVVWLQRYTVVAVPTAKDGLLFYLENFIIFQVVVVGRFHYITPSLLHPFTHSLLPSLPVGLLETWGMGGNSHMKKQELLVRNLNLTP